MLTVNDLDQNYQDWKTTPAGKRAYALCLTFASEKLARGQRFGIAQLVERVRWEAPLPEDNGGEAWKINNNHRAYLARDLIRDLPALRSLITVRQVRPRSHP